MTTSNILSNLFESVASQDRQYRDLPNLTRMKDFIYRHHEEPPISPVSSSWEQRKIDDYTCIAKKYVIKNYKNLTYFVLEVLNLSNRTNHHPELTIDHQEIHIKLYTKDVNDVTDIDLKMSKMIDEIHDDIAFIEEL